jgi:hypothetical protein
VQASQAKHASSVAMMDFSAINKFVFNSHAISNLDLKIRLLIPGVLGFVGLISGPKGFPPFFTWPSADVPPFPT